MGGGEAAVLAKESSSSREGLAQTNQFDFYQNRVPCLSRAHCQGFETQPLSSKRISINFCFVKAFHPQFICNVPLVRIIPKLHHITVLK